MMRQTGIRLRRWDMLAAGLCLLIASRAPGAFRIAADPDARTTDETPRTWELEWTPDRTLDGPLQVVLMADAEAAPFPPRAIWGWMRFEEVVPPEGADLEWFLLNPTYNDVFQHWARHPEKQHMVRLSFPDGVREGQPQRIVLSTRPPGALGLDLHLKLVAVREGREVLSEDPVVLRVRAGPARWFALTPRPAPEADGRLRVFLGPMDDCGFPTAFETPVRAELAGGGHTLWTGHLTGGRVVKVETPPGDIARLEVRLRAEDLSDEEAVDNAVADYGILTVMSGPVWAGRFDGRIPSFGELHWHTWVSDGYRSLDDGFEAGRDVMNLDWMSTGDHSPHGEKWKILVDAVNAFHEPGRFATLFGWEYSRNDGHVNFYFTDPGHPMKPDTAPRGLVAEYLERLEPGGFVAIPHHTNATSVEYHRTRQTGWRNFSWPGDPAATAEYLRLAEIFQARGNFECEDPPEGWRTEEAHRNHGGALRTGLNQGHRIGFVAGTDNHIGWPGITSLMPIRPGSWQSRSRMYTGAWILDRDREDLFEALYDRHTWACWDTRAIVKFTVENALQGGEIRWEPDRPARIRIRMSVDAPVDLLELVANDEIVWAADPDRLGLDVDIGVELPLQPGYVYPRVRLVNGALIYASPVFLVP